MSIALGPLGRNGEALGSLNTKGKMAAMYVPALYRLAFLTASPYLALPFLHPSVRHPLFCRSPSPMPIHFSHTYSHAPQVLLLQDPRPLRRPLPRGLRHRRPRGRELPGLRHLRLRQAAPLRRDRAPRVGAAAHPDARGAHGAPGQPTLGARPQRQRLWHRVGLRVWRDRQRGEHAEHAVVSEEEEAG